MACGCAVVSTDIEGVADYAIDRKTALLGRAKAPDTLAARLIELLSDDRLRVELAANGHSSIADFDWAASTDALEDWFLETQRG
jgi:glycosyltransferase involved in cell wall biosynthesis